MSEKELLAGYKQENEQLILKIAQQATAIKTLQTRLNESVDMMKLHELESSASYFKSRCEQLLAENDYLNEKVSQFSDALSAEQKKTFFQRIFG